MAEDAEVDDSELVEMYDRLFQRRSIDNQIYCVPCCDDDVSIEHRFPFALSRRYYAIDHGCDFLIPFKRDLSR